MGKIPNAGCVGALILLLPLALGWGCSGSENLVFEPIGVGAVVVPDAAGSGGPSLDGMGAATQPDPGLDPDVRFLWKQSLPGQGTCNPGSYRGRFACSLDSTIPVEGSIEFVLDGVGEAPVLEIVEGSINGYSDEFAPYVPSGGGLFSAGLTGELDCAEDLFSAATVDGKTLPTGAFPIALMDSFVATLEGSYDPLSLVVEGDWELMTELGQECLGTFRVNWTP